MNKLKLPVSLAVGGTGYSIRTDYRVALGVFKYLADDTLPVAARYSIAVQCIFKEADKIPEEHLTEAIERVLEYLAGGRTYTEEDRKKPSLVDWDTDIDIILPAINKVAGYDVRGVQELHWWTFLSYYTEIGDSTFSTVVGIRYKMAHGKKLEEYEQEFVRDNPTLVLQKSAKRLREDKEDREALAEMGL